MRTAIPRIPDRADDLKHRRQREHDRHQKLRLQMRDRLASGQAHERPEVARLLGVHRHTIGRWLARDAARGRHALLETYVPAGQPVSLAPAGLASVAQALHRPEGFASDEALRPWRRRTQGVEVQEKTLSTIGRTRFKTKRTGARPTPTKTPCGHADLPGHRSRPPPAGHRA